MTLSIYWIPAGPAASASNAALSKPYILRSEKKTVDKSQWQGFLIFAEQERGEIHPVTYELIGEALKMAQKVNFCVNVLMIGGNSTEKKRKKNCWTMA